MARNQNGWVKIHKKVCDSDIGRNYLLLGLWTTLIRWANWTESTIKWQGRPRILQRGEIVTSLTELATYGEVNRKTVAKWLNYLELRESISVTRSPKGSHGGLLIKVLNYEKYQALDASWYQEHGHEAGHEGRRSLVIYEELKNIRIQEPVAEESKKNPVPPLGLIWNNTPTGLPKIKQWTKERGRAAARLLEKYTEQDWKEVCEKVSASDFLSGRSGKWTNCSFDWVINPKNFLKILEGTYDNKNLNTAQQGTTKDASWGF